MFWSANQPVCVGSSRSLSPGRRPHEAEPGRAEQVLEHAGRKHVDPELPHVERIRADRLVGVEHDEGAPLVRDLRDLLDVEPRAVAITDGGDRHDGGLLVDRLVEPLDGDLRSVGVHVHDLGAAQLLRVPDLADGRELEVADHDLRPCLEVDRARERAHAGRERRGHGDVVRRTADEAGEGRPGGLGPLDPVLPRRPALVPARQIVAVRGAHRVRERALRARVDVGQPLEDREARAAGGNGANGQGRPF